MILSEATREDVPAIARIHRAARRHAMPWLPVLHTPQEDLSFFETIVFAEDDIWVVSAGSEIAGFISYKGDRLNHLYVDAGHRRRHIGTMLLERAKLSTRKLQLWTFQQNLAARLFYTANGFLEREATDGQRNEEKTPDIRMEWNRAT